MHLDPLFLSRLQWAWVIGWLPVILMDTAWSYWVFRGKMRGDIFYH